MSEDRRRFMEGTLQASATATFIAADAVFVGNIRGNGQFIVFGEVRGDGDMAGNLHLSATARWYGHVRAHQAIVAGEIHGGLEVGGKLELGPTAIIRGSVRARTIAIARGAIVDGAIEITSGTPILQFDEKRAGR